MRRRLSASLALALAAFLIAALLPLTAAAQAPPVPVTVLHATLTGPEEVPPGDPDGSGSATLILIPGQHRLCYVLHAQGIEPATGAHVHQGAAGVAGPVVVPLAPPTHGVSAGCVTVADALLSAIAQHPDEYYVNVHNAPYPPGAIRGQLAP